jgi:heme-degrading monooxygenase HmoA
MKTSKPYYAVIFTSKLKSDDGYSNMAQKMEQLAKTQKGFLGIDSARNDLGITVSYWESLKAIASWKSNLEHIEAQNKGKTLWYKWYSVRICKVEHEYEFNQVSYSI